MVYVEIDSKKWSKKHGIEIIKKPCAHCGEDIILDVPIKIIGYVGFEMRKHGCPDNFLAATFVPFSQKEKDDWRRLIWGDG